MEAGGAGAGAGAGEGTFLEYPNGQPAVRLEADGSGFVYYPTKPGFRGSLPVAVCVSRKGPNQFSHFFYDRATGSSSDGASTRGGAPKAPLLCSIDEVLIGFANDNTGPYESLVPGVDCDGYQPWPGKISKCKKCGQTRGEHAVGRKLVLTKAGGTLTDARGLTVKRWLWDPRKQGAGTPPSEPIAFPLNKYMTFEYHDRANVRVTFKSETVQRKFECGERLRRTDTYLDKVTGTCIGELRGKKVLDTGAPTLIQRQEESIKASAAKRMLVNPDFRQISNASIASVMEDLDKTTTKFKTMTVKPYPTPGWKEAALGKTLLEAPAYNLDSTPAATAAAAKATMGRTSNLLATAGSATFAMTGGLSLPDFSATAKTTDLGATMATNAATISRQAPTEGYGSMAGAARKNGRWMGDLDVKRALGDIHPTLARNAGVKSASGRYCKDDNSETVETVFRKLRRVTGKQFDEFVTRTVRPDQLVLVCCLREDDPLCRRTTQVLEHVNGTLADMYPHSAQYVRHDVTPEELEEDSRACPYWLVKFDMAESRFMIDRYNVQSLPSFLAFYNGKLVYAGLLGGSSLIKLPACNRPVNFLLAEPDASSQIQMEKVMKTERVPADLASGTFDAKTGGNINVIADAKAHMARLAESAMRRRGAAGGGGGGGGASKPSRGTDTSGELPSEYAVLLVNTAVPTAQVFDLAKTLRRSGAAARSTATAALPLSDARLCGSSLIVISHRSGTVMPGPSCCAVCNTLAVKKGRRGGGRKGGRRPRVSPSSPSAGSGVGGADDSRTPSAWACPRCNIIQNATRDLLADGAASLAFVKPLKPATVVTLSRLWTALKRQHDALSRRVAEGPRSPTKSSAPGVGVSVSAGDDALTEDGPEGALLGITHAVVLERLAEFMEAGERGKYLPTDFRLGVAVATSETTIRGHALCK